MYFLTALRKNITEKHYCANKDTLNKFLAQFKQFLEKL